jgi:ubiquinone/menaquinone biosynthesis C-methylase UbiE
VSAAPIRQHAEPTGAPLPTQADAVQAQYYAGTAGAYESMHVHADDGHAAALGFISALIEPQQIRSMLDVGCGTGRAIRHFRERHPDLHVRGVEPVGALIRQAIEVNGVPAAHIARARGESLPHADQSFDAVCELGILHHVADPNAVVREMLRVARRAVFVSDANRFGQGSWVGRRTKLALYRLKLWRLVNYVKTRGRGYTISAGDGLAYSYSVFDSYDLIAAWADRLILVPTSAVTERSWQHPLLTAGQVLLCALRD